MSDELQRVHDKINYETNVVDPKTFAVLLEAVRKNQPLSYVEGRDTVFPNARAEAGMQWDPKKVDTHASNTLEQYNLVNATEDRTITVSDLGYKFLACFDESFNIKVNLNYYKTVLLEMIFSWVVLEHDRNIHPGRILFKLMLDSDIGGYHTSNEFALWTSDELSMTDLDYDKIKQLVLEYRADPQEIMLKKAEVFLRPFANSWGLFNRTIEDGVYIFTIKEDVLPLVEQFFIYVKENEKENKSVENDESQRVTGGTNILLYGVPGSGKSWTIENEYCSKDSIVNRLVFHPDYTNADFVGQILPVVDEEKQVTYEFTPGPFTTILYNAYYNPTKKYILIIEEINRGNAPAIFGEVFQLLDRKVEIQEDDDGFPAGTSEYGITHKYMAEFIYGNPNHKVRIPSNLSIMGTMNTSDQNVFTLDTAFQRRWQMRLIENNFDNVRHSLVNAEILDTGVTWRRFCETVNTIIIGNKAKMVSAEDKRLGVYFVHEKDLMFDQRALPLEGYDDILTEYNFLLNAERQDSIEEEHKIRLKEIREAVMHNRLFPEKVIKYLWDDAFKFNPEALFDTDMDNLEKVIRAFVYSTGHNRFKIFKQSVRETLYTGQQM